MSPKREKFCIEYQISLNATEAAKKAGYSERTARSQGQRLLTNVDIQERLQELQKEAQMKTDITRDEVLYHLASIMRAKLPEYFSNGKKLDMASLTDEQKIAMESIRISGSSFMIKLTSKLGAIERINKMLGYDLADDININISKLSDEALDEILIRQLRKND